MALVRPLAALIFFYAFFMYSPTLLDFTPKGYSLEFPEFKGPLASNSKLSKAEHLYEDILLGPESLVFHGEYLYTGLKDGRIVKVKNGEVTTVAKTGTHCEFPYEERLCGRPLGLRKGRDGLLYVIDAYYGLFTMNFTTGALTRILSSSTLVNGSRLNFPDDLDIDGEGNIYFSDASTKWDLSHILYMMFENEAKGRVIRYNMYSDEIEVLVDGLNFPNGVQLSKDGRALLICDLMNRRILKYNLKGPRQGQLEVFADLLPGEPDNIRPSPRGYWVGLTSARNSTHQMFLDSVTSYPSAKRIFGRFFSVLGNILMFVAEMSNSRTLKTWAYMFKRGDVILPLLRRYGIIIEFDHSGNILRSLHSPDGTTSDLSEVLEHNGYLYLGSFLNNYLGRLKL